MAAYTQRPFVRERYEQNSRLADLMMQQGRNAANAQRQQGEISAQMWGNVGNTISSAIGQYVQAKQDEPRRELQATQVKSANIDLAEKERAKTNKGAAEEAIAQIKSGNAEAVLSTLQPEVRAIAEDWLGKTAANKKQRKMLQIQDAQESALFVRKMGYDPAVAEVVFGVKADDYPELKSIWAQVKDDPEKLKRVIDHFADYGKEPKVPEPFTLSPGQQRFGPDGKPIASVPVPEPKPPVPQPFNLSPGQVRYGPDGKPIASLPAAPKEQKEETRMWVVRDGQAVRISESQYRPGDLPANTREQGRPVTSGDAGRISDFDTSLSDLNVLNKTLTETKGATGTSAAIGAAMPAWATDTFGWGVEPKKRQGVIDRVKQVIGKTLEGGVLRKEDEYKYEKILPTIKDTAVVAASKLAGLEKAITQRRSTFLDALGDANYDTSKYNARQPAPKAAAPAAPTNPFRK